MKRKFKCNDCDEISEDVYLLKIFYSPFDDEHGYTKRLCENCESNYRDDAVLCSICGRYVLRFNGHHGQIRQLPNGEEACLKCFEIEYLEHGINMYDDFHEEGEIYAMFFNDGDVEAAGYEAVTNVLLPEEPASLDFFKSYGWDSYKHTRNNYFGVSEPYPFLDAIKALVDLDLKVIIALEHMSILGDGTVSVWVKKNDQQI